MQVRVSCKVSNLRSNFLVAFLKLMKGTSRSFFDGQSTVVSSAERKDNDVMLHLTNGALEHESPDSLQSTLEQD